MPLPTPCSGPEAGVCPDGVAVAEVERDGEHFEIAELSAAAMATFDGFDLSDRALRRIAADLRSAADNAPDQLRKFVAQAFVDGLLVVAGAPSSPVPVLARRPHGPGRDSGRAWSLSRDRC